jgi:hypothetical protein
MIASRPKKKKQTQMTQLYPALGVGIGAHMTGEEPSLHADTLRPKLECMMHLCTIGGFVRLFSSHYTESCWGEFNILH